MNILKENKNELLDRLELVFELESDSTPKKSNLLMEISKEKNIPEENIVIEKVEGRFGDKKFIVYVKLYDNKKSREKYEIITRKDRKKLIEEKDKAEEGRKKADEGQTNKNGKEKKEN